MTSQWRLESGVNLSDANIFRARLINADLTSANLTGADLTGANLIGVNLTDADLKGAEGLTKDQLAQCKSLEGTTMPNGQKYKEWLKSKGRAGEDGENSGPS